jgi:hypothetical protein
MAGKPNPRFIIMERRERVLLLLAQGLNECDIASELKVGQSTVARDIKQIKKESQTVIQDIAEETLPYEFGKCLKSLGNVSKECWNIFEDPSGKWTNKDKINALKLVRETERIRFEVLLNGPVNLYVQQLVEEVNQLKVNTNHSP